MARYCPRDGGEFEDWVETCPDCGATLVAGAPAERTPVPATGTAGGAGERIVFLAKVANEPLAQLWRQVLADNGIRGVVKPSGPGFGGWGSAATLEHELLVLESTLPRARRILHELQRGELGGMEEAMPGLSRPLRRHPQRRPISRPASRPRESPTS
ncbi:MAG: DUF2007 domain-containing protein [Thermomicrobiales bacterium]